MYTSELVPVLRVICNECGEAGKDRPVESLHLFIRLRVTRGGVQIRNSKVAAHGLEILTLLSLAVCMRKPHAYRKREH